MIWNIRVISIMKVLKLTNKVFWKSDNNKNYSDQWNKAMNQIYIHFIEFHFFVFSSLKDY